MTTSGANPLDPLLCVDKHLRSLHYTPSTVSIRCTWHLVSASLILYPFRKLRHPPTALFLGFTPAGWWRNLSQTLQLPALVFTVEPKLSLCNAGSQIYFWKRQTMVQNAQHGAPLLLLLSQHNAYPPSSSSIASAQVGVTDSNKLLAVYLPTMSLP